ncbi:hypothetical protein EXE40_17515, partial [Halorubrum sp. GN11GM_10-3_MGM]
EEVFEDTVPRGRPDVGMGSGGDAAPAAHAHDHEHDHGSGHDHGYADPAPEAGVPDPESVDDPTVAEALREAREMTSGAAADDGDENEADTADEDATGDADPDA